MSKDKLQEIRNNYWLSLSNEYTYNPPPDIDDNDLEYLMKLAYNQALEDVKTEANEVDHLDDLRQSILKLKL